MDNSPFYNNENIYSIIDIVEASIYWKNKEGKYLGCNRYMLKMAGVDQREEIIGKTDYELPWREFAGELKKIDSSVFTDGRYEGYETPTLADRKKRIFHTIKTKMPGNNDILIGVSLDVTEQKEVERLREEQLKIKKERDDAKIYGERMQDLAATVAHEMRTPLLAIKNGVEGLGMVLPALLKGFDKAKEENLVEEKIPKRIRLRLQTLISDMVKQINSSFTFIEMLFTKLRNVTAQKDELLDFSVKNLVQNAIDHYPLRTEERNLIHLDIQDDFAFKANEELFKHVIFNFLKNSLFYIASSHKGEIYIWTETRPGKNILYFKDTGPGISKENLSHIFEKYFTRTYHGAGIGLSFCKDVVESFGGTIACHSIEGEYTEFVLEFPQDNK